MFEPYFKQCSDVLNKPKECNRDGVEEAFPERNLEFEVEHENPK